MKDLVKDFPPPKYHDLEVFEHPKFRKVRVIMIDGNPWFVAVDVCRALELSNPTMALERLEEDEKMTLSLSELTLSSNEVHSGNRGGARFLNVVNEPGLYRLIFSSRKKEALEFQRWVYHEVLPSIRKYGCYPLKADPAPVVSKPKKNLRRVAGQKSRARVYAFRMINGKVYIVKIGQSKNVEVRKKQIERETKLTVDKVYKTSELPRRIARALEKACHKFFAKFRVKGELFAADYDTVCNTIDILEETFREFPILFDEERAEMLLNIGSKIESLAANQAVERALLMEAANIIAGKELVGVVGDIFLPASK